MANDLQVLAVDGKLLYTFDWTAEIPASSPLTTISSVAYSVPSAAASPAPASDVLTFFTTSNAFSSYQATIGIQNAIHGKTYQVQAAATLSNGEVVVKDITIKGFNG